MQRAGEERPVLDVERALEPELRAYPLHHGLRRVGARDQAHRIARHDVQDGEGEERDTEEHRHRLEKAPEDVPGHARLRPLPLTLPSPQRGEGTSNPSPPEGERVAVRADPLASSGEARAEMMRGSITRRISPPTRDRSAVRADPRRGPPSRTWSC